MPVSQGPLFTPLALGAVGYYSGGPSVNFLGLFGAMFPYRYPHSELSEQYLNRTLRASEIMRYPSALCK